MANFFIWIDSTHPSGHGDEPGGVSVVNVTKRNGSGRKCSSRLGRHIGSWAAGIHFVSRSRSVHILWSLPALMIGDRVTHLQINCELWQQLQEFIGPGVGFHEIVGAPADGIQHVAQLACLPQIRAILHRVPR